MVNISLKQKKVCFDTIFPIIIPHNVDKINFNISNIEEYKKYNLYVLRIEKGNTYNQKIQVKGSSFDLLIKDIENKDVNFIVYAIKGNEINTFKFDSSEMELSKLLNFSNAEKFSSIFNELVVKILNLDKKINSLEDEIYKNDLL